jgi:hypothetical protein
MFGISYSNEEDIMAEIDYTLLQQHYGGCFVAQRDGEVVVSAETYDELSDQLEQSVVECGEIIIEYVEPVNVISVYGIPTRQEVYPIRTG